MFHLNGIIRYEDMLVIDAKGDSWNEVPHIFIDFVGESPVSGTFAYLKKGQRKIGLDSFSREDVLPKSFPKPNFGKIYDEEGLALPEMICEQYVNFRGNDLDICTPETKRCCCRPVRTSRRAFHPDHSSVRIVGQRFTTGSSPDGLAGAATHRSRSISG